MPLKIKDLFVLGLIRNPIEYESKYHHKKKDFLFFVQIQLLRVNANILFNQSFSNLN